MTDQSYRDAAATVTPRPCGSAVLSARSVSVRLGKAEVLAGVSVEIRPGDVLGLIGPNGSGKTTLLKTLAGLIRPASGEVLLDGRPVASLPTFRRARQIAYMPQFAERHPFTAFETVLMGRYPHLGRFEIEGRHDRALAADAMRCTATSAFGPRLLDTLSGGERQRVLLARTLAQGAPVMLLDEPTSALDLKHRLLTMQLVREETAMRQAAVAIAVHDLALAARYCDRLALLSGGRVVAQGLPGEVVTATNIRDVFGVEAAVELDLATGRPQVTLIRAL